MTIKHTSMNKKAICTEADSKNKNISNTKAEKVLRLFDKKIISGGRANIAHLNGKRN